MGHVFFVALDSYSLSNMDSVYWLHQPQGQLYELLSLYL